MFDGEPAQVNFDFLSESEDLGGNSLSGYDCDSEGGDSWNDVSSEDSETRGTHKPGIMGLKFQLDAAKAGKLCCHLMDPHFTELHSPDFNQ